MFNKKRHLQDLQDMILKKKVVVKSMRFYNYLSLDVK